MICDICGYRMEPTTRTKLALTVSNGPISSTAGGQATNVAATGEQRSPQAGLIATKGQHVG
jgi:hypothetical protein